MDVPQSYRKCGFSSAALIQLKDLQTDMLSFSCKVCNLTLLLLFSLLVMSNSLQSHGLQHTRLSCLSPSPRDCSNSCQLSQWCQPAISSSAVPFSSCLQSFPALGSFPMSWLFVSSGQSTRASASVSVLPMNIQNLFPLGWTGLISLLSKGLSIVFSTTIQRNKFFGTQPYLWSNSHNCIWRLEKP